MLVDVDGNRIATSISPYGDEEEEEPIPALPEPEATQVGSCCMVYSKGKGRGWRGADPGFEAP